jgi:hypothetical protein
MYGNMNIKLSKVVIITTAIESEKYNSSRYITLELELPRKRVISVFIHTLLRTFPHGKHTTFHMAVVCNCEENIFLAHSISCAI